MKKTGFNINGEGMATNQPGQTDDSTLDSVHACQSATPHSHIPCKSRDAFQLSGSLHLFLLSHGLEGMEFEWNFLVTSL